MAIFFRVQQPSTVIAAGATEFPRIQFSELNQLITSGRPPGE